MIRNGEIAFADVKRILRRYWWIPTFMTVTLGVLGLTASLVLPEEIYVVDACAGRTANRPEGSDQTCHH